MKKTFILSAFVLVLMSGAPSFAQYADSYEALYDDEAVSALKEHVATIASSRMDGRKAGSEGEKAAAQYVYEQLEGCGLEMLWGREGDSFGLKGESDTLVSLNVGGFIQGYDSKLRDRYIVVGARLDNLGSRQMTVDGQKVENIAFGANGNASGLSMLIELARKASTNRILFKKSVIFVAFGASGEGFAGSWYFLNRTFADDASKIDLMINLDMLGSGGDYFYAYSSSNREVNDFIAQVSSQLQPIKPEVTSAEPYPSDHRAFYAAEIPSVMFTTGRYPEYNTNRDTPSSLDYSKMERELEYIGNFVTELCSTSRRFAFVPEELVKPGHEDDVISYYDCDFKPTFLGTSDISVFMQKWVYSYLKYPKEAVEAGIQGTVQVNFIIEKDGNVSNVTVVKGAHELLDAQAVKVIEASPKWKPAKLRGKKVRSAITVPVEFRLEKKGQKKKIGINGKY